jgi:hypothetical protein
MSDISLRLERMLKSLNELLDEQKNQEKGASSKQMKL